MAVAYRSTTMFSLITFILSSLIFRVVSANVASASFNNSASWGTMSLAVNIPTNSTTNDDLYFSFSAPSKFDFADRQWAGFAMGSGMNQALLFVIYQSDTNGSAPTVSVRTAQNYGMPTHYSNATIQMESGSSSANGIFTANFHCTGCRSWPSGSLNINDVGARFFFAMGPAQTLVSTDPNAQISQHPEDPFPFNLDLTKAQGAGGVPVGGSGSQDGFGSGAGNSVGISAAVAFHILAMVGAFVFVFPVGYLFLRLFNKVWLHWPIQSFGMILVVSGAAAGIAASEKQGIYPKLTHPHQILGLIAVGLVLSAWIIGLVGHRIFKKNGTPSPIMKGHRVVGPLAILTGVANGFVGFVLAGHPKVNIFYGLAVLGIFIFVGGTTFIKMKRDRTKRAMNSTAANNFREGEYPPPPQYQPPYGTAVPMQTFNSQPQNYDHGYVEQVHVHPK